jgi:hypothetical protein
MKGPTAIVRSTDAWICPGAMDGSMERRYGYIGDPSLFLDLAI